MTKVNQQVEQIHPDDDRVRVAVIGAGSWGTALAISLARGSHAVSLWARRKALVDEIRTTGENKTYLAGAQIDERITVSADLEETVQGANAWVFATPAQSIRQVAGQLAKWTTPDHYAISVAKGIENDTLMLSADVMDEVLEAVPADRIGVLYGPSHAEEVARRLPTVVVASAREAATASYIQRLFMTSSLRVYMNTDLVGVQIGGSVKNVMAIAAGISDGVGFGDNAKAAIVTRGIAEIRRLGVAMGAEEATFSGLSGIGDLVVTCMSGLSRNRYLGAQLGAGKTLAEVQAEMHMVAEGVSTTRSVVALARKHRVDMPISEAVHAILFENLKPLDAVSELMDRTATSEDWA